MADEVIWLIYGLGFATGFLFLVPVLYFLVRNRLRRDWVWALIRGRDGRYRAKETKPDKSHLHLKTGTYEIDPQHISTYKRGFMQSPRNAWLYAEGDPRPINLRQQRIPELDAQGKPTGAIILETNPDPLFKPAEVWQAELGSHIVSEALGRSRAEMILLVLAIIGLMCFVAVLGLYAR